jgi:hypothetical protein
VWNGLEWVSFRAAFEAGILALADHGKKLDSECYRCAFDSPWEYTISVTLWQIENFFVLDDESGEFGGVFDNLGEARAAFAEAAAIEETDADEENSE